MIRGLMMHNYFKNRFCLLFLVQAFCLDALLRKHKMESCARKPFLNKFYVYQTSSLTKKIQLRFLIQKLSFDFKNESEG